MRKIKHSKTMRFKLSVSYVLISVFSVCLVGILGGSLFSYYMKKQIQTSNRVILDSLKENINKDILEKADSVYISMISKGDEAYVYPPGRTRDEKTAEYKHDKQITTLLSEYQVQNAGWLTNIYMYSGETNTLIGTYGIIRPHTNTENSVPAWMEDVIEVKSGISYLPTTALDSTVDYTKENGSLLIRKFPINSFSNDMYVFFEISERTFSNILKKYIREENDTELMIIDEYGNVISSTKETRYPYSVGEPEWLRLIHDTGEKEGFVNYDRHVVSFTTIEQYGWKMVCSVPHSSFYAINKLIIGGIIVICSAVIILGSLMSGMFTKRIYNPISMILKKIDYSGTEDDEYTIINNAFLNMKGTISSLRSAVEENRPLIKNDFFNALIYGKISTGEEFERGFRMLGEEFSGEKYTAVIIQPDSVISNMSFEDRSAMIYSMIDDLETMNNDGFSILSGQTDKEKLAALIAFKKTDYPGVSEFMKKFGDYLMTAYNINCVIAVGEAVDKPYEIHRSFEHADAALKYRFFMPRNMIIRSEEVMRRENDNAVMPEDWLKQLKDDLDRENKAACKADINEIVTMMIKGGYSASYCNSRLLELLAVISTFMRERGIKTSRTHYDNFTDMFNAVNNIYEFEEWISDIIDEITSGDETSENDSLGIIMESVKEYVKENIAGDLSLNTVARAVFISPQYLSKMFKEKTGINFSEYVTEVRMETAAERLLTETSSIETIARETGYNTPHYFAKRFKEKYGVTPKGYRINHLKQS